MNKEIGSNLKKGRKILLSKDSELLNELKLLMELKSHRTLIMWAFDCANTPLNHFEEKFPNELRPRLALEKCEAWARGKIKMNEAKKAILNAHQVAKEINDKASIALCHAIGHAGATVHVKTHALGLPIFELTSIVLENPYNYDLLIDEKIKYYIQRLLYWDKVIDTLNIPWAQFLIKK